MIPNKVGAIVSCFNVGFLVGKYVVGLKEGELVGRLVKSQGKKIARKKQTDLKKTFCETNC